MRRSFLYACGIFCLTRAGPTGLSNESRHQVGKFQKIRDSEKCTALADDDRRVGRHGVRPVPWHRAHLIGFHAQQDPRAVPIVPLANADELPSAERVKRVRDAHKTRRCVGRACILC
jgi:hypothetical protein